jgi:hypothetical protein
MTLRGWAHLKIKRFQANSEIPKDNIHIFQAQQTRIGNPFRLRSVVEIAQIIADAKARCRI